MATDLAINTDRTQKFIDDLEAQKTIISSCTQLFTTLTTHFTSLQQSLISKSQILDSNFQILQSKSDETLESLSKRESSIPQRESSASAKVEEQKAKALAEFENSPKFDNLSEHLKSCSRKMDASGLLKFVISKRKESVALRAEISAAVMEAVDPARLVLEAVDEFVKSKIEKVGVTDKRWACGMLVQVLFPDVGCSNGCHFDGKVRKSPAFSRPVIERAGKILERWKEEEEKGGREDGGGVDGGSAGGVVGPAEAVMFLQMVVVFGLKSRFDEEYLKKLVMDNATRRDMAKLAVAVGFGRKMEDMIDELVKNGKEVEAVYFASEAGLTEKYPPVSLLKSFIKNFKTNGNDDSNTEELNSIKAVIKCVEDHKLEPELSLDSLRKRVTRLEKTKAERKKSSAAAASAAKSQNKRRASASSGRDLRPPAFRPGKAAKFSNAYSPLGRRNPASLPQHSPAARYSGPYNYHSQSGYSTTPFTATYRVAHAQSPAAIPQQRYSVSVDNTGAAGFRASGSYAGQATYGTYDYGTGAASTYQPSSYTQ
ncbi:FRIGIDA-like protein 4a [Mercurialis annua]|uniref:FRIGIDA-like protein 4a n=1 Tax=Mercurialis annua TaxID=3986 RepID=UPI00215F9F80|nr:FRIGIDA-like protein 4a [Mercurialis annua]